MLDMGRTQDGEEPSCFQAASHQEQAPQPGLFRGPVHLHGLCVNVMLPQIDAFLGTSHGPMEAWLVGIG